MTLRWPFAQVVRPSTTGAVMALDRWGARTAGAFVPVALVALIVGCATVRPSPASLDAVLSSLRCQHAALNAWDTAALARLAETCGPTVADCTRALGEHEADLLAARVALDSGYRAVQMAARQGAGTAEHAAARVADVAARAVMTRLDVDLVACP